MNWQRKEKIDIMKVGLLVQVLRHQTTYDDTIHSGQCYGSLCVENGYRNINSAWIQHLCKHNDGTLLSITT